MIHNYNTLIKTLEIFSTHHLSIRRFKCSFAEQLNNFSSSDDDFPILYSTPTDVVFQENIDEFTFRFYCVDILQKDRSNESTILNETLSVLRDLTNFIRLSDQIDLNIIGDPVATPVNNFLNDFTVGWTVDINFEAVPNTSDCVVPFTDNFTFPNIGIDVGNITVPFSTVIDGSTDINLYSGQTYTCEVPEGQAPKSGIQYQRDYHTFQTTSYAIYDDAWQLANGGYDYTELVNPLYVQRLDVTTDTTGYTLFFDNAFGNKIRFTDVNGSASLGNINSGEYIIDNLTGLAHIVNNSFPFSGSFDSYMGIGGKLEGFNNSNLFGFNDYFIPNFKIMSSLTSHTIPAATGSNMVLPLISTRPLTSTTRPQGTTSCYRYTTGEFRIHGKAGATEAFISRVHFK